ncbi:MAG: peptidylprolyl isomerase [Anaerolineales bacterium]|nr:peptidylprolyl isomerase [Anaerolineales bacterium]
MHITKHTVVAIDYTLTDDAGGVLDSSRGGEPLAYLHGVGQIIPGLERALEGKAAGEAFQVAIAPADGYGERDDRLKQQVTRDMFEGHAIEVGMQFMAQMAGAQHVFTVVGVDGDDVTVDGNHPLAGVPLNFDVTVVSVRAATEEELSHGHAHSAARSASGDDHGHAH